MSSNKTPQQQALEQSELWKLYQAVKTGETDRVVLMTLARQASSEFCRNHMTHFIPA